MTARARLSETVLALIGAVVALWPLTTLLEGGGWLWGLILLCGFVAVVGAAMRTTRAPAGAILLAQLGALLLVVLLLNLHDHLDSTMASAIQDLVQEADDTVRKSAVPAPVTPGLLMMLEIIVPGLAICVDFLSVTCRQPALAGVPLMIIYMLSTSNSGSALNPFFFIALAAAWLTMLAHGSGVLVRSWSSVRARALTPSLHEDQLGLTGLSSAARTLGIATIVLALVVPVLLPHPDPHYFAKGLGRGGKGGGEGVVAFSTTVNLAKDLRKTDGTPVLTFKSTDLAPPPLRVTTGGTYSDGEWKDFPGSSGLVMSTNGKQLPLPAGASKSNSAYVETMKVTDNTMSAPNVPAPFPVASGNFGQTRWGYSPATQQPYVSEKAASYELDYRIPQKDAYRPGPLPDRQDFAGTLRLDSSSSSRVRELADSIGGGNSFDQAVRIQNYLRGGDFTYSLKLAPTRSVDGKKLDPLSNFLVTKQGYCTQFATAMIMLARADGIPARMALGFLPGAPAANDTYTVLQSSAHAWPELYLRGLGWTRFEPTPGTRTGAAPTYTNDSSAGTGGGRVPSAESSTSSSSAAAPSAPSAQPTTTATPSGSGQRHTDWWGEVLVLLAVLAVGLLGALVLPLLARRQRESINARLREHRPVEAQWQILQTRLGDLGIPPPEEDRSPRATERYYRSRAALPPPGLEALHSAVRTLEQERYAAPGTASTSIDRQSRQILDGVRHQQSWPQRIGSTVLPASGRASFRRGVSRVFAWPTRLLGARRR